MLDEEDIGYDLKAEVVLVETIEDKNASDSDRLAAAAAIAQVVALEKLANEIAKTRKALMRGCDK